LTERIGGFHLDIRQDIEPSRLIDDPYQNSRGEEIDST